MTKVISLVGAGGKTSIMNYLAAQYDSKGSKAIMTTTTHICKPEGITFIPVDSEENINPCNIDIIRKNVLEAFLSANIVCVATQSRIGKLSSPSEAILDMLYGLEIPMIIEADGSKRMPVKAPEAHEPVIYSKTDIVYAVLGADGIGESLLNVGFRLERLCEILSKQPEDLFDINDYVRLFTDKAGLHKAVTDDMTYIPVLSKVDTEERKQYAREISRILESDYGMELLIAKYGEICRP